MLRAAAKKSVEQGIKGARAQSTQGAAPKTPAPKTPTPQAPSVPKKSGGSGLALTVGALTAGAGGVVGYAYVDPEFRNKVETTVPQVKPVFESILGSGSFTKTKKQISDLKDQVTSALPKKKDDVLPPLAVPLPPAIEKKPPVEVTPVDVTKTIDISTPKPSKDVIDSKNQQLEKALMGAIQAAELRVQKATSAKMQTINAVNEHAAVLKQTVDDAKNADWEKVTTALQVAESKAKLDATIETEGRNYVDSLRKLISEGKTNSLTASNPLLINASETANKLSHQMDELNALVKKSRQESSVLNQYKDLIERSREQFALEMKSILPNVDIHAKDKNLNEDELNALIAHAHLKVDQLRRQLTDQQVREEQHIDRALEEQRRADERISSDRLDLELNRVKSQQQVAIERAVLETRSEWETEIEDQLKRTSAAHSDHLEQVVRTQRQLFEIEHNQKVEEAVLLERDHHSRVVGQALSRLEGIEHVLNSRVALDAENRKAKQFWIACHNLIDNIRHGRKAGADVDKRRLPLQESLECLQEVNPEDSFANVLIENFPQQAKNLGVYTELDLKNRFDKLYKLGRRTATIDENGGSLSQYAWSYLRSMFLVDLPRRYNADDKIDPLALDNIEILSRAKWCLDRDDMVGAVQTVQLLRGEPANLARDWVQDSRAHLESLFLAQLLVAHAAATSIRSTY